MDPSACVTPPSALPEEAALLGSVAEALTRQHAIFARRLHEPSLVNLRQAVLRNPKYLIGRIKAVAVAEALHTSSKAYRQTARLQLRFNSTDMTILQPIRTSSYPTHEI